MSEEGDEEIMLSPRNGGGDGHRPSARDISVGAGPSSVHVQVHDSIPSGGGGFGVTVEELQALVDPKDVAAFELLGGVSGLAQRLRTDLRDGIRGPVGSEGERCVVFGDNRLPPAPSKTLWELCWEAAQDKVMILLCVCAVISIIIATAMADEEERPTAWIEGFAILVAVAVVIGVTGVNDFQKEKQFRKLNATKDDRPTRITRGGEDLTVSIHDIEVGDIVHLETGDKIGTDGVLIDGHSIKTDESAATGESDAVPKSHEKDPFFLSGSQVMEGVGRMLVINVGVNSYEGKTLMGLRVENESTPLEKKLDHLAELIGKLGLGAAVLVFIALVIKHIIQTAEASEKFDWEDVRMFLDFLMSAVTIVVVAVPEGLPLSVTIALAYSMMKMLRDNNLVRHLAACETMGSATQICSDKTGTLTQNKMTVVRGNLAGHELANQNDVSAIMSAPESARLLFVEGVEVNSTSRETTDASGKRGFVGSKTESAMLEFTRKLGGDYAATRESIPPVHIFPFSSALKRMTTVIAGPGGTPRMHVKGASEIILDLCDTELTSHGDVAPISEVSRKEHEDRILEYASGGLRTIAVAFADLPRGIDLEAGVPGVPLTLLGIVGIQDPVRPEVPEAVADCQNAGITVRMVTGDNAVTARHIASECGIFDPEWGIVMEGPEFRNLSDEDLTDIIPRLQVLARSSPLDKQILVAKLKAMGEIVAVTGDGTNDAPALKMANVGFSMGIAGTEVAKEASEIVLMDDNFASIVSAVMWGRNVFDSIRKFLQFQVTVNIVAVIVTLIGSVSNSEGESPLKPIQLLYINLLMDAFAALALATDDPTRKLLDRDPTGPQTALITRTMWLHIAGQGIYQIIVCLVLLFRGDQIFHIEYESTEHHTLVFNAFVWMTLFNEFNCRKINQELNVFKGMMSNFIFIAVMIGSAVMEVIIVELGGVKFMKTHGLGGAEWLACILFGLGSLPVGFVLRLIPETLLYPGISDEIAAEDEEDELSRAQLELQVLKESNSGLAQSGAGATQHAWGAGSAGSAGRRSRANSRASMHESDAGSTRGGRSGISPSHSRNSLSSMPRSGSDDVRRVLARRRWQGVVRKVRMQQRVVSIFETIHRPTEGRRHPSRPQDPRSRWQDAIAGVQTRQRVIEAFRPQRPPRPSPDLRSRAYSAQ